MFEEDTESYLSKNCMQCQTKLLANPANLKMKAMPSVRKHEAAHQGYFGIFYILALYQVSFKTTSKTAWYPISTVMYEWVSVSKSNRFRADCSQALSSSAGWVICELSNSHLYQSVSADTALTIIVIIKLPDSDTKLSSSNTEIRVKDTSAFTLWPV